MTLKYIKQERVWLQNHPELNEKWVQDRLVEDPSLLGLGDIALKDKERIQAGAGRLDLLFQDIDKDSRYEVEIQLGRTDESHIIRTIEYWDIERKRYPQYDHTAVIIAEDITSRFLNVISLFNGFIPLVAIQLQAYSTGDGISLVLTKVLDQMRLGLIEEVDGKVDVTDRAYWEKRASKNTLEITDRMIERIKLIDKALQAKYNKFYIGMTHNGIANNFIAFKPKKEWVWVEIRLEKSDEIDEKLKQIGLDDVDYDTKWGKYWIRISKSENEKHIEFLEELFRLSYNNAIGS
jgi:predicted transport protein